MRLTLGTAQFGLDYGITNKKGKVDIKEIKKIISLAKSNGIFSYDTAQEYGDSEKILGQYTKDENFNFTTKISNLKVESFNPENIKICHEKLESSLKNLNIKSIDTLLMHDVSDFKKPGNIYLKNWLKEIKNMKLVKKIGVSIYDQKELLNINRDFLDVVQIPISLYNQKFLKGSILGDLKKLDSKIQARSIFLQGLLITPSQKWPNSMQENLKKHHSRLESFLKAKDISLLDIALAFIKSINYIDSIIIGITSVNDLQEIIESYNKELPLSFEEIVQWDYMENMHLDPRYWNYAN